MADRRVFMFGSRSLLLDERRQASRRGFEAWILTSRKICSEESEWKSESSYWILKSEDNSSGKMAIQVGGEVFNILKDNWGRWKQDSRTLRGSFMARRKTRVLTLGQS
ncbi:uncharacterized protein TNCV_3457171 [Trichonephila clavipes]|nr:uncharacterized protein TNCV_3457171 [Trichonephila clavipes]